MGTLDAKELPVTPGFQSTMVSMWSIYRFRRGEFGTSGGGAGAYRVRP
jgi:hypothetical protein